MSEDTTRLSDLLRQESTPSPACLLAALLQSLGWHKLMIGVNFVMEISWVPSGKLTVCYGQSPSLIGKSARNVQFLIAMSNYQMVIG